MLSMIIFIALIVCRLTNTFTNRNYFQFINVQLICSSIVFRTEENIVHRYIQKYSRNILFHLSILSNQLRIFLK